MATLTIEIPDDLAQKLQDFCARVGVSVSKWFNDLFDNGLIDRSFEQAIDEDEEYEIAPGSELWKILEEDEEMTRHPEKYKSYTDLDEMEQDIIAEFAGVSDEELSV